MDELRKSSSCCGGYPRQTTIRSSVFQALLCCLGLLASIQAWGVPGDINADGAIDGTDYDLLTNHLLEISLLEGQARTDADANEDGKVDVADAIFIQKNPRPLLAFLSTSPANGEQSVAVTRETVLRFNYPLDPASVGPETVFALYGNATIDTRIHLSPDYRTLTLFYPSYLPASALVRVFVDESRLRDSDGRAGDLDGDGSPAGMAVVQFETLGLTLSPSTSVYGRVFATELAQSKGGTSVNVPLAGVRVSVDGLGEEAVAVTDVNGGFRLDPAPAGRFFVHIDGRTVTQATIDGATVATNFPDGPYYPFVGKPWDSIPGTETNVGDVYLPLIEAGSLQPVSNTETTTIRFPESIQEEHPEFAGVSVTVPAGSLYADDGTLGGSVGIAPVPPDRMPGPLPPGLTFPVVISVQTDGATNFDTPVPVCFPNLPDPVTDELLAPGEKSALWSFDHDTGQFSIVGSMTVSDDGLLVCTDPGVGLRAPGWHGTQSGSGLDPFDNPDEGCEIDQSSCNDALLFGAADCLGSFLPGLGGLSAVESCLAGVGLGGVAILRDCALGMHADCVMSESLNTSGILAGCVPAVAKSLPYAGSAIACGFAAVGAARSCTCLFQKDDKGDDPPYIIEFELHLALLEAFHDYHMAILGDARWSGVAIASQDPLEVHEQVRSIFDALVNATASNSAGGTTITSAEAESLAAIPIPNDYTDDMVPALVARYNRTAELWAQGVTTHAAAGRTDFIDQNEVLSTIQALDSILTTFLITGHQRIDFASAFAAFQGEFIIRIGTSRKQRRDLSTIHYRMEDVSNGVELRGRLDAGGNFGVAGIAADSFFRLELYDAASGRLATTSFISSAPGGRTRVSPPIFLPLSSDPDIDDDGLSLMAESILGTYADNPDSDGDGLLDGLEVQTGSNPLDGLLVQTGIIASVDTPGTAVDAFAADDRVVLADGTAGVSIFNVYNGMPPAIMAQIPTPGHVRAVYATGDTVLAADETAGLLIIDTSDLAGAEIAHQTGRSGLKGRAICVTATASLAYVGADSGALSAVDIDTGRVVDQTTVPAAVNAVAIESNYLYVLTKPTLYIFDLRTPSFDIAGSVTPEGVEGSSTAYWDLFVGGGIAYATHIAGYNPIDVSNPFAPLLITNTRSDEFGWHQTVLNGSGIALAARGPGSFLNAEHNIVLYDATDPESTLEQRAVFATPGAAVGIEIYNGLAYVADNQAGMHVLNYLGADRVGMPPSVSFSTNAEQGEIAKGSMLIVNATAFDDAQVRNVELLENGRITQTDGNFPFQFFLTVPRIAEQNTLTLRVRASDTSGNRSAAPEQVLTLTDDNVPPEVTGTSPRQETIAFAPDSVQIRFSEPIAPDLLSPATVVWNHLGADTIPGGGDDLPISIANLSAPGASSILIAPSESLIPGVYELTLLPDGIRDLEGASLAAPYTLRFGVAPEPESGVTQWARLTDGIWNDPTNWSNGLPGATETVLLDVPGEPVTVTLLPGRSLAISGLHAMENVALNGGELTVTGSTLLEHGLTIADDGRLTLSGNAATLTTTGPILIENGEIRLESGASATIEDLATGPGATIRINSSSTLTLPNTTAFNGGYLILNGASVLNAPLLANVDDSRLEASGGGQLALPLVTGYTAHTSLVLTILNAFGNSSQIDLPALAALDLAEGGQTSIRGADGGSIALPVLADIMPPASQLGITVTSGGNVSLPQVVALLRTVITQIDAESEVDLSALLSTEGGRIDVRSSQLDLPAMESAVATNLLLSDGATLNTPELAVLSELDIDLGAGATWSSAALAALENVDIHVRANTSYTLPNLTELENTSITLDAAATFTSSLTRLANSVLVVNGGAEFIAPSLSNIDGTSVSVNASTTLALPQILSYTAGASQSGNPLTASGAGAQLQLPALATFDRSANPASTLTLRALNGGMLDLGGLQTIVSGTGGSTRLLADGAGAQVNAVALLNFDVDRVQILETNGGTVLLPE